MTARDEGAGTMEDREEWRSQILIAVLDAMRSWRGHTPERVAIEITEAVIALAAQVSAPGMDREEGIRGPHEPAALGRNGPSAEAVNDGAPLDLEAWEVEVRLEGQSILTIGRTHLSGLSDIEPYGDVIRECADHLHAFIGKAPQPGHCALGDDGCVCFFDHEHCDNWRAGQEVRAPADGSQVEPSTTGAGRHNPLHGIGDALDQAYVTPLPELPPFIQWNGGENPVPEKVVEYQLRDGGQGTRDSDALRWEHIKGAEPYDIIAYRIIPTDDQGGEVT